MKFKIAVTALLIAVFSGSSAFGADSPDPKIWEPLNNSFYYNKKMITRSPGLLLVWTYKMIPNDLREKTVDDLKKSDPDKSIKYRAYHHETVLWEIDCPEKRMRTEEFIDFDREGKIIDRYRTNPSEWMTVFPKTGGESLYKKACLPQQEPVKKKKRR